MPAFGWTGEQFLEDYAGNRRDAVVIVLEASAVATTLRALVESPTAGKPWCGTASELLKTLNQLHDDGNEPRAPGWPQSAQALGNHVRRLAPALRVTNIDVAFRREPKTGRRLITVEKRASRAVTLVTSVTPTAEGAKDDEKIARDGLAPTNDRRFPHGGDESDDVLPWISMAAGPGLDAEVPLPSELCGPGPGEAAWAAGLEDA